MESFFIIRISGKIRKTSGQKASAAERSLDSGNPKGSSRRSVPYAEEVAWAARDPLESSKF